MNDSMPCRRVRATALNELWTYTISMKVLLNLLHALGRSPTISTWASFLVRALPLAVLPYFIFNTFPAAESAFWFVLITLQGLQLLLENAIGLSLIRAIGYALGGAIQVRDQAFPDSDRLADANVELLSRIWTVMGRLYVIVGTLTLFLVAWAGLGSTGELLGRLGSRSDGLLALAVFVVGAAARAYGGKHIGFLFAVGQIARLRWAEMVFWALSFLFAVGAVIGGAGILGTALAYQAPQVANLAWNMLAARQHQATHVGFNRASPYEVSILAEIWPSMWRSGIGVLLFLGVTQGAGLYYATVGDARTVAIYLFAMSLMRPMMQFAQVPFFTKLPRLAAMQAAGQRQEQIELAARGIRWSHGLLASMILAGSLALTLQFRFALELLPVSIPLSLWALIGLAACLERVGACHIQLHSLTNRIIIHWANGGTALLFVVFAWLLLPGIGVMAFPAALCLASAVFYVPFAMWHSYRAFQLEFPEFELRTSAIAVTAVLLLTVVSV